MHRKAILILIALVSLTYVNALFNGFIGDDGTLLVDNTFYRSLANVPRLFLPGYNFDWTRDMFFTPDRGSGSVSYRPLDNLTYFFDYAVWGLNAFGFHFTNVLIHLANTILFYFVLYHLGIVAGASLFAAALFSLHPLQSEAVCNVGYRADILATFFVLLAVLSWMRFRRQHSRRFYFFSLGMYFCAIFSKESALVLPLFLFAYERIISGRGSAVTALRSVAPFFACMLFYVVIYCLVFPNTALPHNPVLGGSWYTHILTMVQIGLDYMRALLLPTQVTLLPTLYAPVVFEPTWAMALGIIGGGIILAAMLRCNGFPQAGYALAAWAFIFYLPVSDLVPLANPMAYRFMYLPSAGFLGLIALFVHHLCSRDMLKRLSPSLRLSLLSLVILTCMVFTALLNGLWKNNYLLASTWVKNYPNSWKANEVLGILYYERGEYLKAQEHFLKSLNYVHGDDVPDVRIYWYLGMCYFNLNQLDRAALYLKLAIHLFHGYADAYFGLGRVYYAQNKAEEAVPYVRMALNLVPNNPAYYIGLMDLYWRLGNTEEAAQVEDEARKHLRDADLKRVHAYKQKYLEAGAHGGV